MQGGGEPGEVCWNAEAGVGPWLPTRCGWGGGRPAEALAPGRRGNQGEAHSPPRPPNPSSQRPRDHRASSPLHIYSSSEAECRARGLFWGVSTPARCSPPLWNPPVSRESRLPPRQSCFAFLPWLFLLHTPSPGVCAPRGTGPPQLGSPRPSPHHTHFPSPSSANLQPLHRGHELKTTAWILSHCRLFTGSSWLKSGVPST